MAVTAARARQDMVGALGVDVLLAAFDRQLRETAVQTRRPGRDRKRGGRIGLIMVASSLAAAGASGCAQRAPRFRGGPRAACAHASPAAGDRHEDLGRLADERRLDLRREHEIAVALRLGGEGGEDPAADAEIRRAHVRALLCPVEAEREPAEVVGSRHTTHPLRLAALLLPEVAPTYHLLR